MVVVTNGTTKHRTHHEGAVMASELTKGFAFVATSKVPKQERVDGADRLAAYREKAAAERKEASAQVAAGLLAGKALTDNLAYDDRNDANKTGSRAKTLAAPALKDAGKRPSLTITGSDDDGWRWWVTAVDAKEKAAE